MAAHGRWQNCSGVSIALLCFEVVEIRYGGTMMLWGKAGGWGRVGGDIPWRVGAPARCVAAVSGWWEAEKWNDEPIDG